MSRESFEKWLKDAYHGHQSQRVNKEAWWAYQAGQIEQREVDAKICEADIECSAAGFNDGKPWLAKRDTNGLCAAAIRTQSNTK